MEEINERYEKLSEIENYKQIDEDFKTGKTFIIDYNSIKECNKYGIPLTKFYPNVTGQKSFRSRKKQKLIKEIKYENPQYLPNTPHLIGSSMCPRQLSISFFNKKEKSDKMIDTIKKDEIYNSLRNKNFFDLEKSSKDSQKLPSYFCVKLGADSPKTRNYLINLFDKCLKEKKNEYNNDPTYYLKDSSIIGLSNYKKIFQKNLTKNKFNGKIIPYTKQTDINYKFKITKRLIKKEGWNKMHLERQNINHDVYERLYKIKRVGNRNNVLKRTFSYINSVENKKDDNYNNIYLSRDNIGKDLDINKNNESSYYCKINKDNNREKINALLSPRNEGDNKKSNENYKNKSRQKLLFDKSPSYQNYNNFNKSNKFGSTMTTCFNYNNESQFSCIIPNKNKNELYTPKIFHNFQRSLSNFINPRNNFSKNNDEKSENPEKIEKKEDDEENNDLSYSREETHLKRIKKLIDIKENCEHENKLMKGYQMTSDGEELGDVVKKRPPKFQSPISIYRKEIDMFKKVNPIEYEKEQKRKLFDDKMLMKKLQNKKIFERIKIKKNNL